MGGDIRGIVKEKCLKGEATATMVGMVIGVGAR